MLNDMQKKFVDAYMGNATEAARIAGYKQPHSQGPRLLEKVEIKKAIQQREKKETKVSIATRQQRQEFWTNTMYNGLVDIKDRLKASELLGKSQADFTDKLEATGKDGGPLTFVWDDKDG